jgi:hypothetical protein
LYDSVKLGDYTVAKKNYLICTEMCLYYDCENVDDVTELYSDVDTDGDEDDDSHL